jgi:hypothetical protein
MFESISLEQVISAITVIVVFIAREIKNHKKHNSTKGKK